jgi:hypothetical protein
VTKRCRESEFLTATRQQVLFCCSSPDPQCHWDHQDPYRRRLHHVPRSTHFPRAAAADRRRHLGTQSRSS